eukprot:gene5686-9507_t
MSQTTNQEDPLYTIQNWPYFNFFGPERNLTGRNKFKELYKRGDELEVVASTNGAGSLVFAANDGKKGGVLHSYNENYYHECHELFEEIASVDVGGKTFGALGIKTENYKKQYYIKVFNSDKFSEVIQEFPLITKENYDIKKRGLPDFHSFEIVAFDVSPDDHCIACAINSNTDSELDGKVILIQGDLFKQKPVYTNVQIGSQITGIAFVARKSDWGPAMSLFITTDSMVYKCDNPGTFIGLKLVEWDDQRGCDDDMCTVSRNYRDQHSKSDYKWDRFVMATDNEILFYGPENKDKWKQYKDKKGVLHKYSVPCLNEKASVSWFRSNNGHDDYLIVVHNEPKNQLLRAYFLEHQIQTFSYALEPDSEVVDIIKEQQYLYLIIKDKSNSFSVIQFEEKADRQKIEILVQNARFENALKIAEDSKSSKEVMVEIERQYGDYEFNVENYSEAIVHYANTIGTLEPSYTIRKFLKAVDNKHLLKYLDILHDKGKHNPEHTVLFIKFFTKEPNIRIEVEENLENFIEKYGSKVDADATIRAMRDFGYLQQATSLAKKVRAHEWYIKIHLEDYPDSKTEPPYLVALQYVESLEYEDAVQFMKKYSPVFIQKYPKQTTNLLIRLCVAYYPTSIKYLGPRELDANSSLSFESTGTGGTRVVKKVQKVIKQGIFGEYEDLEEVEAVIHEKEYTPKFISPDHFISGYLTQRYWLMVFLENVIERIDGNHTFKKLHTELKKDRSILSPLVYNTLLELYLEYWELFKGKNIYVPSGCYAPPDLTSHKEEADEEEEEEKIIEQKKKIIKNPFASIITQFKRSVEYETLYDIFPPNDELHKMSYEDKILHLLSLTDAKYVYIRGDLKSNQNQDVEDDYPNLLHALILCQSKNFIPGVLHIFEKLGLFYDIIKYYMDINNYEMIKKSLRDLSKKPNPLNKNTNWIDSQHSDSYMYLWALQYFVERRIISKYDINIVDEHIKDIIKDVEDEEILSPIEVIDVLLPSYEGYQPKEGTGVKIKLIKDYFSRKTRQLIKKTEENNESIKANHTETTKLRSEIEEAITTATVCAAQKCSKCALPLELPTVHFMCKHSFHLRCATDEHCPKCWDRDLNQRRKYKELSGEGKSQDDFISQRRDVGKDGGFENITDYLGKGLFLGRKYPHQFEFHDEEDEIEKLIPDLHSSDILFEE